MATVINRSRFSVSVPRHPDLARTFPYNAKNEEKGTSRSSGTRDTKPSVMQR